MSNADTHAYRMRFDTDAQLSSWSQVQACLHTHMCESESLRVCLDLEVVSACFLHLPYFLSSR